MTQIDLHHNEAGEKAFCELFKKAHKLIERYKAVDGCGADDYILGIK